MYDQTLRSRSAFDPEAPDPSPGRGAEQHLLVLLDVPGVQVCQCRLIGGVVQIEPMGGEVAGGRVDQGDQRYGGKGVLHFPALGLAEFLERGNPELGAGGLQPSFAGRARVCGGADDCRRIVWSEQVCEPGRRPCAA